PLAQRSGGHHRHGSPPNPVACLLGRGCGFATLIEGFHGHHAVILVVCPSGRRYSPRKRVRVKPPRVQIPPPPQHDPRPSRTGIFLFCPAVSPRLGHLAISH